METAPSGGAAVGYSESVDSSPRSRGGESWDEPFPSSAAPAKLRLMCSYGGHIVPRPHDKSLCYLGGDTRIVVVDRNTTLADLSAKLSRSLLGGRPFSVKYQLPSEDLDSLISVTTDEDLDNMIEEYDRINSSAHGGGSGAVGKTSRLRLFLFPSKVDSSPASSMGSLLDDSKSETWFVDALNGAIGIGGVLPRGLSADSMASSVNCLLGLEENQNHSSVPAMVNSSAVVGQNCSDQVHYHHHHHQQMQLPPPDSSGKLFVAKHGQEVHSVPDSPMLDTSSSFGSTSSGPCLSNLPPIRVRPDDRGADQRGTGGGLEEHFSQMNLSRQKQDEGLKNGGYVAIHHQHPAGAPINGAAAPSVPNSAAAHLSPTENPNEVTKVFSHDDEKLEHEGARNLPQKHPVQQQKPNNTFDLPVSERPVHHPEGGSPGAGGWSGVSDPKQDGSNPPAESNYRVQVQAEQSYMLPIQAEPLQQLHSQAQQLQQQQFFHANPQLIQHLPSNQAPHLVQHHPSAPVVPIQSYYQMQIHPPQPLTQTHPYGSQLPMYYMSVPQNPGYVMPMQQPNLVDTGASAGKPTPPLPTQVPPPRTVAPPHPQKPDLIAAANVYRASAPTGASVSQPSSSPQLIHFADQNHQYMGYPPMHLHQSQSVAASSYGYEFSNPVHAQPIYYTQATSVPLPSQYQTVSSGATIMSDVPPQLQQPDLNQTRASS